MRANAEHGLMVKSCSGSKFIQFQYNSPLANKFLGKDTPMIQGKPIQVLQLMLSFNDYYVVEYKEL